MALRIPSIFEGEEKIAPSGEFKSEADGTRTRNHRIDSPVL
jgi:hypothetical protein